MPRSYRNISMYEKEILELISQGKSLREIGEKLGFSYEHLKHNSLLWHIMDNSIHRREEKIFF